MQHYSGFLMQILHLFSMILRTSDKVQLYELHTYLPSSHSISGRLVGNGFSTINFSAYQNSPTISDRNMTLKTDT